jgi:hypothetical protein
MTTPVKFEIAKLLKEKGFNQKCKKGFFPTNHGYFPIDFTFESDLIKYPNYYLRPTMAEAVMWLYEKHGIWIGCTQLKGKKIFDCDIEGETITKLFNSPTEAYEAAIEYCLTNLI